MPDEYTKMLLKFDKGFLNISDVGSVNTSLFNDANTIYCDSNGPFLGNSSYLDSKGISYTSSDEWAVGGTEPTDFAIDFYFKIFSFPSSEFSICGRSSSYEVHFSPTLGLRVYMNENDYVLSQGSTSGWSTGVWYHVAITRTGSTYRAFRDGVLLMSNTITVGVTNTGDMTIASWSSGSFRIANIRVSIGTPRWTSNFTKPAYYHTVDSYTKFLVTFEMDHVKRHHFQMNDTPAKHELNVKKWGRGSWKASSAAPNYGISVISGNPEDFQFGTGDFTIDFQLNFVAGSGSSSTELFTFVSSLPSLYVVRTPTGKLRVYWGGASLDSSNVLTAGQWYHVAITKAGTTLRIFIDGVLRASATVTSNFTAATSIQMPSYQSFYFAYYIDEFRISKGIARWTEDFTPPTGEYVDYKLSGAVSQPCTITIFNDATKVVEEERQVQSGSWTISPLTNNKKIIMAKLEDGETICYGEVWPVAE